MLRRWYFLLPVYLIVSFIEAYGQVGAVTYSIYFRTGKAELDRASKRTLDSLLNLGLINGSQSLAITGYADEPGSNPLNDSLSYRRARATAGYLQSGSAIAQHNIVSLSGAGYIGARGLGDNAEARRVDITAVSTPPTKTSLMIVDSLGLDGTFELDKIFFEAGKAILLPSSSAQLQELRQLMENRPTLRIRLEGHICCGAAFMKQTSNPMEAELNERQIENGRSLSLRRAEAVYLHLKRAGISAERISFKGFGFDRPKVFPEKTPEDEASNRRVEVRILSK
jgi:outer membrane protein OmpA-like peptidoglycan-associated protein